ncbi:hypothetical protein TNCV_306961 [Trichonephila clavipes]|nr:hypothetical protein TNCV_306961 [Trichonephila clavipes]
MRPGDLETISISSETTSPKGQYALPPDWGFSQIYMSQGKGYDQWTGDVKITSLQGHFPDEKGMFGQYSLLCQRGMNIVSYWKKIRSAKKHPFQKENEFGYTSCQNAIDSSKVATSHWKGLSTIMQKSE